MDRSKRLGTKKISTLLAQFAIPSIASLVLHAFYNVADRIFIGRGVGSLGLTGVTLCFPIILLIFGVCMMFSSGASALISIHLGENRQYKAEKILGTTIAAITVVGLALAITGNFYYKNIIGLFNMPPEVLPYAEGYLRIILSGGPLFLYGFTLTFIIRAEGNPIYATAAIVTGTVINLILDPIFIFLLSMGTEGAALATIISEGVVALMGLFYMTRKKGVVHIRRKNLRLDIPVIRKIGFLGLSTAFLTVASSVQLILLNERLLVYGGNIAVAAIGIIFPIYSILRLFTAGMAAGMQPIVGYNYGAGQNKRAKDTFYYACKINFLVVTGFVLLVAVFARGIVGLFSRGNIELTLLGAHAIRIFLIMASAEAVTILGSRYFQAIGKGAHAIFMGLLRQVIIFVPVLYILSSLYGLEGIWFSGPVTDFTAACAAILFITREMKKHKYGGQTYV